jgi:two-component system sensor histidine kinase/response regulator
MAVPVTMRGGRPRVLLVDDRPENLLALTSVLEGLDAELIQARSGTEALRRLLNEDFALIVLDVQMPTLDGFETARLIKRRQRTRHIPIVFLTAISGEPEHYLRGYSAGAIDYVHKPFSPEVLRAKVSVLLELWHRGAVIERQRAELEARLAELDRANERLARQAVELERSNAALERFAEVAAHELRQPLRNVAGFVELWLARQRTVSGEDDEAVLLAERAAHGVDELRALTDSLLAYAKTGTELRREPVPLAETLEAATKELATVLAAAGATVEAEILPTVAGDRRLLVQLFANLLDNAVKFGGDEPPAVRVRAEPGEGAWKIGVKDNGLGVDPADVPRLFTIFARLHPGRDRQGHGVGLAVCRRIVELHGGTIWCEPAAVGTTMWFTLPRDAD